MKISYFIEKLENIAETVNRNIYTHGVKKDENGQDFFTYEVDCYGNHYFMDDPGYPSLIGLPFLGFVDENDPIYLNTRKRILSNFNPYYIKGTYGDGLSSSHSYRRWVWPLFTIMRAITTEDTDEILACIKLLQDSASGGFIHESFNIDNPSSFTRSWFAWANSFFGYMINSVNERFPNLLLNQ